MKLIGKEIFEKVNIEGIVLLENDVVWLEHVCSGIQFEFYGKWIEIELQTTMDSLNYAWISIYVNNEVMSYEMNQKIRKIILFDDEYCKKINIKILKRTEKKYNNIGIKSINILGQINKKFSQNGLKIGFIGDSISCGYGVERGSLFHNFSTKYENGLKAYPYILSNMFHADYEIIAFSGIGVWKSHRDFQGNLIEKQYIEACNLYRLCDDKQLMIINIGTNDSGNIKSGKEKDFFYKKYKQLVLTVKKMNPSADIVCMVGPMECCLKNRVKKVCADLKKEGLENIYFIEVKRTIFEGIGKGKHPTVKTQRNISKKLYQFIKSEEIV